MSSPGWFLGAHGADCQTTCDQVGLECSESHLLAHNVDLGHAFALRALFVDNATNTDLYGIMPSALRGEIPAYSGTVPFLTAGNTAYFWPATPNMDTGAPAEPQAYVGFNERALSDVSCSGGSSEHRICFCHDFSPPPPPPSPPPSQASRRCFSSLRCRRKKS